MAKTPQFWWLAFGFAAQTTFFMRFVVQWFVSERRKKSVIPIAFWYLSLSGGLMLTIYAVYRRDPVFIIGQGTGVFIYLRNIILLKGRAGKQLATAVAIVAIPLLLAVFFTPWTPPSQQPPPSQPPASPEAAYWLIFGFFAQSFFFMRFLVQWIASERRRESIVPDSFWYMSMAGGLMLGTYALHRMDPVFVLGQVAGVFIYARNIIFIHKARRVDGKSP